MRRLLLRKIKEAIQLQRRLEATSTGMPTVYTQAKIIAIDEFYKKLEEIKKHLEEYHGKKEKPEIEGKLIKFDPQTFIAELESVFANADTPNLIAITAIPGGGKTTAILRMYNASSLKQPSFFSHMPRIPDPGSLKDFFVENMKYNGIDPGTAVYLQFF